ncbi:hypothetical protein AAC387_Pa02g3557 [Persea americana]
MKKRLRRKGHKWQKVSRFHRPDKLGKRRKAVSFPFLPAKIRTVWGSKKRGGVAHFRRVVASLAGMALTTVAEEGRGKNDLQRVYAKDGLIELLPEQGRVDPN